MDIDKVNPMVCSLDSSLGLYLGSQVTSSGSPLVSYSYAMDL